MFSYGPPHMAEQKQGDQLEPTYSSSVRIRDVALRTCQKRWTIERSGKRGSGSVLAAQDDDDDDGNDDSSLCFPSLAILSNSFPPSLSLSLSLFLSLSVLYNLFSIRYSIPLCLFLSHSPSLCLSTHSFPLIFSFLLLSLSVSLLVFSLFS